MEKLGISSLVRVFGSITMVSGNFEQSLAQLEDVVQRLERGDLPLEEGLASFEEGVRLSRQCQEQLDVVEKRVASLSREKSLAGVVSDSSCPE